MLRRILSRAGHVLIVLFMVSFLAFSAISLLPGDAAAALAGENASPRELEAIREELGLERPFLARYADWLAGIFHGDLGRSFITNQPVAQVFAERIPVTFEIALVSQLLALVIAVPLALYSALRPGRLIDRSSMVLSFGGASIPNFVFALLLIYLLAGGLVSIFPTTGYVGLTEDPVENLKTIAMPCISLAIPEAAVYRQVLRSDMVSTLREDFILMARSKGLPSWHILLRHALRPSSFSLITLSGLSIGRLLGGTVIIETLFAIPGIGQLLVQSVYDRDYIMMQGALLFVAVAYVVVNMLVDLTYVVLDPRVRRHV